MTNEVNRATVSLGIDFRPLPIDIGDGTVWGFDPDPAASELDGLIRSLRHVGKVGQELKDNDSEEFQTALGELKTAVGRLLVDPKQRTEWGKKTYGLGSLNALSNALIENTTGFTQKSPKGSGKG